MALMSKLWPEEMLSG